MAAQSYKVRFRDGTTTTVAGVLSETVVHEELYDMENYRDEFLEGMNADADIVLLSNGIPLVKMTDAGVQTKGTAWNGSGLDGSLDDRVGHVPPRPEPKKRSRLNLWSGAAGSGDRLFFAWCDQILGYSIGDFTRV